MPETRLRQRFLNNLGLHTCCTEIILHCVSVSNQLQQWTNFCTNFSPEKWGSGGRVPLLKKVGGCCPPASLPHYTPCRQWHGAESSQLSIRRSISSNVRNRKYDNHWLCHHFTSTTGFGPESQRLQVPKCSCTNQVANQNSAFLDSWVVTPAQVHALPIIAATKLLLIWLNFFFFFRTFLFLPQNLSFFLQNLLHDSPDFYCYF